MRFTRLTIFHLLYLIGIVGGLGLGAALGQRALGTIGAIVGGLLGMIAGGALAAVPDRMAFRSLLKEIEHSPNARLLELLNEGSWNFRQTLALMHLSVRGHDIVPMIPRILEMLESDSRLTRIYGWDALRLAYTDLANRAPGYDPRGSLEDCRRHAAALRGSL